MKTLYLAVFMTLMSISYSNAQYFTRSFSFGGTTRQYILYVPSTYDGSQPVPFVMALHGLGDNMTNFKNINLKAVADTANFIFAIPQALVDQLSGSTAWNSGAGAFGITLNANVDDVGFLNALIDTVSAGYNINQARVYATGFSMGGFMSNRLACQLNNRIAAVASVSGTIGNGINCQPDHAVPVAHFHGTADATVAYSGNQFGKDAETLVAYWVNNNGCDTMAIIDSLPDTKNDGKTVIRYKYINGNFNSEVYFYKVIGGAHEWLSAANDINYSVEIWNFFNRFEWTFQPSGVGSLMDESRLSIFPNPAKSSCSIKLIDEPFDKVDVLDLSGRLISHEEFGKGTYTHILHTDLLAEGSYLVRVQAGTRYFLQKLMVSR